MTQPTSTQQVDKGYIAYNKRIWNQPKLSHVSEFIQGMSNPLDTLVPTRIIPERWKNTIPIDFVMRCSHCVATLPPKTNHKLVAAICRRLDLVMRHEKLLVISWSAMCFFFLDVWAGSTSRLLRSSLVQRHHQKVWFVHWRRNQLLHLCLRSSSIPWHGFDKSVNLGCKRPER